MKIAAEATWKKSDDLRSINYAEILIINEKEYGWIGKWNEPHSPGFWSGYNNLDRKFIPKCESVEGVRLELLTSFGFYPI